MQCPSMVYVSVNRDLDKLVVHKVVRNHNHIIYSKVFKQYPEQRRLKGQAIQKVEEMLALLVKVKLLQDHLQKQVNDMYA